jgi:molecular chaperone IbpA
MRKTQLMGMIELLDSLSANTWKQVESWKQSIPNWPPYNFKKTDENHYVIEMAVAGFGSSDLDITMDKDTLVIKGSMTPDPKVEYIHKGIAERAFEMAFPLPKTVEVKNASLVNGMLKVWLENFVPEDQKPRKIEVKEAVSADLKTVETAKIAA